jgi:hypothetical protein
VIRLLASALAVLLPFGIGEASGQGVSLPAYFDFQGKLDRDGIVAIEGRVSGDRGAALVVRIDDAASKDYASRANLERALPRGPFPLGNRHQRFADVLGPADRLEIR